MKRNHKNTEATEKKPAKQRDTQPKRAKKVLKVLDSRELAQVMGGGTFRSSSGC